MSHEGIRFVDKEHAARETEAAARPLPRASPSRRKRCACCSRKAKVSKSTGSTGTRAPGVLPGCAKPAPAPPAWSEREQEGRKPGQPKPKPAAVLPMYDAAAQARQRPRRGPLRTPVQLAGRALRRNLLLGVSAPRLPVPGVHVRRRGDRGHAELSNLLEMQRWLLEIGTGCGVNPQLRQP